MNDDQEQDDLFDALDTEDVGKTVPVEEAPAVDWATVPKEDFEAVVAAAKTRKPEAAEPAELTGGDVAALTRVAQVLGDPNATVADLQAIAPERPPSEVVGYVSADDMNAMLGLVGQPGRVTQAVPVTREAQAAIGEYGALVREQMRAAEERLMAQQAGPAPSERALTVGEIESLSPADVLRLADMAKSRDPGATARIRNDALATEAFRTLARRALSGAEE